VLLKHTASKIKQFMSGTEGIKDHALEFGNCDCRKKHLHVILLLNSFGGVEAVCDHMD
jgi:hypothetical protein